jgi:hypothetical protein
MKPSGLERGWTWFLLLYVGSLLAFAAITSILRLILKLGAK